MRRHTDKIFGTLILAASLCGISNGQPATPSSAPESHSTRSNQQPEGKLAEKTIRVDLKMARLPDLVALFSQETGRPVLADAYVDDLTLPALKTEQIPLSEAMRSLPTLYDREVLLIDGVLVLRHRHWAAKVRHTPLNLRWRLPAVGSGELRTAGVLREVKELQGTVREIASGMLGQQVTQLLKTPLVIEHPLRDRRVSLSAQRITPSQLATALAALLNGAPSISIRQTKEQRLAEDELYKQAQDQRREDVKLSDELKQDLAPLLTAEQRALIENGQQVHLPFDKLPPAIQQKANRYFELRWAGAGPDLAKATGQGLDRDRGFTLNLDRQRILGIIGYLEDGRPYFF